MPWTLRYVVQSPGLVVDGQTLQTMRQKLAVWVLHRRPMYVHRLAASIMYNGTSLRRYRGVKLVEVPVDGVQSWLDANSKRAEQNPLLSDFSAMSHQGPYYANWTCAHFTDAQKVIKEGGANVHGQSIRTFSPVKRRRR